MGERRYFYSFSFTHAAQNGLELTQLSGNVYMGYPDNRITLPRIMEAKEAAKMPKNSVLIAVSFLGRMRLDEFNPDSAG